MQILSRIFSFKIIITFFIAILSIKSFAQTSFVIWPIYPKIESNENATAIWLDNTGKNDAMVQVRVFKWDQKDFADSYQEQNEIIPSPPIVKIKAGERNMLRITRVGVPADYTEKSYRVIVDELPIKLDNTKDQGEQPSSSVGFQMRYSIPLFSYGKGIGSGLDEDSININNKNPNAKPVLTYSLERNPQGASFLYIQNTGDKFARISAIQLEEEKDNPITFDNVAFGYVLAKSTMKFPLSKENADKILHAKRFYVKDNSGVKEQLIEVKKQNKTQN